MLSEFACLLFVCFWPCQPPWNSCQTFYINGCWLCSVFMSSSTYSLLLHQGLHPMHLCAQQNRSDLHWGTRHHLQGAPLRTHLSPPSLELRWPAGENVGLPEACAHVRVVCYKVRVYRGVWTSELKWCRARKLCDIQIFVCPDSRIFLISCAYLQLHKTQRPASWLHISSCASWWTDISWGFLLKDSQKPYQRI